MSGDEVTLLMSPVLTSSERRSLIFSRRSSKPNATAIGPPGKAQSSLETRPSTESEVALPKRPTTFLAWVSSSWRSTSGELLPHRLTTPEAISGPILLLYTKPLL